jgi:hypothetical protein
LSTNCHAEAIEQILKCEAKKLDADIINIIELKPPDFWSTCYRVKAKFLKDYSSTNVIDTLINKFSFNIKQENNNENKTEEQIVYDELVIPADTTYADTCWTAILIKKGNELQIGENKYAFSKNGFLLCKGCIYDIELNTNQSERYFSKLIDIKKDTLVFTNFMNKKVSEKSFIEYDTLYLNIRDIRKFYLVEDRALGIYSSINLDNYDILFNRDTISCKPLNFYGPAFYNDSTLYEFAPYLTGFGLIWLYEKDGNTFYFEGITEKPSEYKIDTTHRQRYPIWFTPCGVEQIIGIAIGLSAENMKNFYYRKDTLEITGINVEVNPFAIFSILGPYSLPHIDSLEIYKNHLACTWTTTITGINFSLVGNMGPRQSNGLTINGLNYIIYNSNWISITGLNTTTYEFKGVSISGLRNKSAIGEGVQIGLFNSCTELKGFQIGLWNTNSKRSLPFINWDF